MVETSEARSWGEIKRVKPLSNSSSFIWQHFKCSPFTTSRRDSLHSRGRVLLFLKPKYIKAIYCNNRRQTSLLVFLPQTSPLHCRWVCQMPASTSRTQALLLLFLLSSSSLFEAVKKSQTIWTCLMDNLKNSACKIRAEEMPVFSLLSFRKQVVQRDLFSFYTPFKIWLLVLRPLMYA